MRKKTYCNIIGICLMIVFGLTACNRTAAREVIESNNNLGPLGSKVVSTDSKISSTETVITDTTENEIKINQNIFLNIGKTYNDIEAKYGHYIESDYFQGGRYYIFKDNPQKYFFGNETDELPTNAEKCYYLITTANEVFVELNTAISISELEEDIGISMTVSWSDFSEKYLCSFNYNDCLVTVMMGNSENIIKPDMSVDISYQGG